MQGSTESGSPESGATNGDLEVELVLDLPADDAASGATHYELDLWQTLADGTALPERVGYSSIAFAQAPSAVVDGQLSARIPLTSDYDPALSLPLGTQFFLVVRHVGPLYAGPDTILHLNNIAVCSICGFAQPTPNPIRFPGARLPIPPMSPFGM